MSLKAQRNVNRNEEITLEHATHCPVNTRKWPDCTCGLFQGFGKPLAHLCDHEESCPCHCTCDFTSELENIVETLMP